MHELLPLSWIRIDTIRPVYRDIALPLSRIRWITYADIPHDYSTQILHEDLLRSYPDGFVFRGCSPVMAAYFLGRNCGILRTGAEAVLDLRQPHLSGKTVSGSLIRGRKHGFVEEISLNDKTRQLFEQFRLETKHAGKPQLLHLFRQQLQAGCRIFVFRAFSGKWHGVITLSSRGKLAEHTELMLRHRDAPGDIMECLVAGIFDILKNEGRQEWSLGEVPFIMPTPVSGEEQGTLERLMVSMASVFRHAYDYEALYRFKNKFAPLWRPVMLCSSSTPSPLMLAELAVTMGFADLLAYQSFSLFRQWLVLA